MKQYAISAFLLMLLSCGGAVVPVEVQKKLLEIEPSAQDVIWTFDRNIYQADYMIRSKKTSSYFDVKANWLETETEITFEDLPKALVETLKVKLSEYSMVDFELVKTQGSEVFYEVDLKKGDKSYDILFDKTGKILRKHL